MCFDRSVDTIVPRVASRPTALPSNNIKQHQATVVTLVRWFVGFSVVSKKRCEETLIDKQTLSKEEIVNDEVIRTSVRDSLSVQELKWLFCFSREKLNQ